MILRIDVDHSCYNKYLSYLRLTTGIPVPHYLNHAKELKNWLAKYPIKRIWFFRPRTCPQKWDEPHGLHTTNPNNLETELEAIETRLGKVHQITRHGHAHFASGRQWTPKEKQRIQDLGLQDISDQPHITISRTNPTTELNQLKQLDHILFHPIYFKTHRHILEQILEKIT